MIRQMEASSENITYQLIIQSPIGLLGCLLDDGALHSIDFILSASPRCEPVAAVLQCQLEAYFRDANKSVSWPLGLHGTTHQQRVWRALLEIPRGEVRTYGDIARQLGSSAQAVGNACRNNPIPVVVPCHRVISAQGIGGYAGETDGPRLAVKRWLLAHESVEL